MGTYKIENVLESKMRSGVRLGGGKRAPAAVGERDVRLGLAFEVGRKVYALDLG